jgi:hypothetical protein
MATVIYGPSMTQELGLLLNMFGMIQDSRMRNAYKDEVTNLLSGRKKGRSEKTEEFPIKKATGFEGSIDPAKMEQMQQAAQLGNVPIDSSQAFELKPTGFQTELTTVPVGQRSPQELKGYDIETRRMLDALGAGVSPQYRVDSRAITMWPEEEMSLEDKLKSKEKYAVTGLQTWRGFDKETGEPIKGAVQRARYKPTDTKNIIWDTDTSTEKYYGAKAGREAKEIGGEINLQKLLGNYIDDPTKENEIALKNAYKSKGYTLVKPETSLFQRVQRTFGIGDVPPVLMAVDKKGNYISIDEVGNETVIDRKKPKKSSLSDKYGY